MVFMDIPDYSSALQHCIEALKPKGGLIFSILHPCFEESGKEWKKKGFVEVRNYFQELPIKQDYGYFIHRQLSTYLNSVIQAGCTIQQVLEPQLDFAVAKQHDAERYRCVPGYMVIYATRAF
jgi:hypothetical protein